MTQTAPQNESITSLTPKDRFMRAAACQPVDRPPVWLMRQAGRYMPEYQAVKAQYSFHEMCRLPQIAADVTMQPIDVLGVDAAIIFNDILIPLQNMGFQVEYREGGPVVEPPARGPADLERIKPARFDDTPPVYESIAEMRRRVGPDFPILGFAGAPFTMAAYMAEGVTSKNLRHIKTLVFDQPDTLKRMLDAVTETVIDYLRVQIRAGADAVQIFDTWGGTLSKGDYRAFALPWQKQVVDAIQSDGTPVILYVKGSAHVVDELKESGAQIVSVDWLTPLGEARRRLGDDVALQGNLDPTALYASPETVSKAVNEMLGQLPGGVGHIVNLGHGILPETPVDSVKAFVDTVKAYDYRAQRP